jgi:hypothetical protein
MCSKEQVLNPISGKCIKKTSETGKLIQYYNWYINMDRGSNSLYENNTHTIGESNNTFYQILKQLSKFELLLYLSDLGLEYEEGQKLKLKYPGLKKIDIASGVDPIEILLEEYLSEQQEKGQLYEVLWDILIKLGLSNFENNYYHIIGNVNLDNGEEYLKVSKIPDGTKTSTYTDYFKKKCISGNTTGVSDISLKHKNSISRDDRLEACEIKDIATKGIDNTIYISCKYYGDDNKKRISEYDLQNILSLIKNKYKKRIDSGEQIPNFDIYLFVKDKLKVQETINRANKSSEYLRKNIKPENVLDITDLKQAFWRFYNFINNYRKLHGVINNNIFRQITGDIKKPSLQLRFHQEYTVQKTIQNIGSEKKIRFTKPKNSITQLWGMIPRSGKTYTAGGLIKEYSRIYTKHPCRVLVITSAPTETKGQWIDELFKKYQEFDDWTIKEINSKTIDNLRKEKVCGHLVYVASKQYLDTGKKSKKSKTSGEDSEDLEDVDLDQKKLEELRDLATILNFNLIIFDENHLAGTTEKAKKTLDLFGPTANKILLTATFNKSIDKFDIPSENIITWDMKDIALCKQFDDPRKMSEFINNHPEDKDMLIDILLQKYGINYYYYTQFNKETNGILENYYLIKGKEFIDNLYKLDNAKQLYNDLAIYPEVEGILQSKYDINLSSLTRATDESKITIEKCRLLSDNLLETVKSNNNLISEQDAKIKIFIDSYKLFPDLHFIGLNFANEKLKELLGTNYGFSMNALFKPNKQGTVFENTEAIDKLLDQISGGISVPQHQSLFSSIRKVSIKYNSRTLQDGEFTSQLWFIPFGQNTIVETVSALLQRKLSEHPELGKYKILSLYDDAAKVNNDRLKEYIKEKEIEAKSSGKKGLIILSGQKLKVGVSLKCVDIVFLLNDVQSYDTIYQSMFRALTESTNKKVGFVVDLNPFRMIEAIYVYSDRNVNKKESIESTITKNIRNMLFYVDDYLFEFEDSIERSNKIIQVINDINRDNPRLQINIIEKQLSTTIDNIQFDLDNIVFLKQLYEEAKDIIDVDKKKKELLNDNLKDVIENLGRGVETTQGNNADARRTTQTRELKQKEKQKVKNVGLIIIPFIKLFVVLTLDDESSLDLISMYKDLTTPEMLPILLDKLDKWGVKDKQRFLMGFGRLIKTMYNSTEEQFINDAISIMTQEIRKNSNTISREGLSEGGGNSKLSYILKNIHKISITYNKFNSNLQKLGLCTNNKDTCQLYSKYYLTKYNYLFNKF